MPALTGRRRRRSVVALAPRIRGTRLRVAPTIMRWISAEADAYITRFHFCRSRSVPRSVEFEKPGHPSADIIPHRPALQP